MRLNSRKIPALAWFAALALSAAAAPQFQPIDLSADIHRPWGSFQPFSDWTFPAGGRQTLNSVPFDIAGVVQFSGMEHTSKGNVRAVRKTFVANRNCTQVHLLHYAEFSSTFGQPVAMVLLHYDDGEPYSFPLRFGVHCLDWYHNPQQPASTQTTACVWMAAPPASRSRQVTGIWHTVIPNPHPARRVKHVEIQSMFAKSTYCLIGLTLEAGEPKPALEEKLPVGRRYPPTAMPGSRFLQFKDESSGQSVAAAKAAVWLRDGERTLSWGDYLADADGKLTILLPSWSYYNLEIIAAGANHAATRFSLPDNFGKPSNEVSVLKLKRGKSMGGTVRDSNGTPVSNAVVSIISVEGDSTNGFNLFTWPPIRTDPRGRWSASGGDNLRGLEFRVSHPDFVPAEYELGDPAERELWILTAAQLLKSEAKLELLAGRTVSGRVLDTAGRPVTNATVACFIGEDPIAQRRANTDASGQFSIRTLEPGNLALIVSAPEHAPALIRRKLEATDLKFDVELKPAVPLRVKVQGPAGEPIRGAYLLLVDWQQLRWIEAMPQSNADGLVTFRAAPLDEAKYLITAPGMSSESLTLRPAADAPTATLRPLTRSR